MRRRVDDIAVLLAAVVMIGATLLTGPTLREVSSVVSVVCFMGLVWRVIGTLRGMTVLSVMLAASLCINLATGAVAQYLLSRQIEMLNVSPSEQPDNVIGISLVFVSRIFILFVIVTWSRWLGNGESR
jgi:hypothetical protein